MKIAVTGGNGDLGRTLIPLLVEHGHTVVSIDRALPSSGPDFGKQVTRMIADVCDYGAFVACVHDCTALIHLAAHRAPGTVPDHTVYVDNTTSSYYALSAAATLGINRVCLASSINAIGGVFSRSPRYAYFPVDEQHPTFAEDPYSLSKWVLEQQADAFARRYPQLCIASLRFHWLLRDYDHARAVTYAGEDASMRHLWAYTRLDEASRACLLAVTAPFTGHEVFYIAAPQTAHCEESRALAERNYPGTPIREPFGGHDSFFNCAKAERLLGWRHMD
ncbi:MAG: NAD(P)-dependent oxidoreductase [Herpetosiphon sp.]